MRKILFIMVLATALVFAFSGVAMAKYAGYAYNNPLPGDSGDVANPAPGYLSWSGAKVLNPTQSGPHGGYAANTVKCAVCHSVHRAASDRTEAGVGANRYLTEASASCVACHTAWGTQPTDVVVEYGENFPATGTGPHANYAPNCMGPCHAGVHGWNTSQYTAASRFLLNPVLDAKLSAGIAAGNTKANVVTDATLNADYAGLTAVQKAANRATVTGYLCAQSGCHTSSMFAVNTWGYAEERVSDPSQSAAADPDMQFFTGHGTAYAQHCGTAGCHSVAGNSSDSNCATCHDLRGVATNSSAFPHGNRKIAVYEWVREAPTFELTTTVLAPDDVESGNLWMYTGDATHRDASGNPTSTAMYDGNAKGTATVNGYGSSYVNTRKLVTDAIGHKDVNGFHLGNMQDGVCLKCHGYGSAGDGYWQHHGNNPSQDFSSK